MKHAYVVAFNTNVGTRDNPKWENRASLMISGYGELHMRVRQGQIKYADNPVLVYEGDEFRYGSKDGKPFLDHVAVIPRKSDNIIACYLRIERNDGSVDYKVLSMEEVLKLKAFSKQQTSLAWTSGLPGMIQAKTIKHAFRSYPKMRMGEFSGLETQVVDTEIDQHVAIDYGLNGSTPVNNTPTGHQVVDHNNTDDDESFAKHDNNSGGASVSFADDEF
jgi:recombinational DNA repair protein RecT